MRTTLDIDDAVLDAARALARDQDVSLGRAVSILARRGLTARSGHAADGFPVFETEGDADPITLELVNAHRDD